MLKVGVAPGLAHTEKRKAMPDKAYQAMMLRLYRRNREIRKLREAGWSMARIGRRYKISRQRVWTILGAQR